MQSSNLAPTTEQAVLETIERMTSAFEQGDVDGIMGTYEAGALVVFEPESPVAGAAAIRETFESYLEMDPHFEYAGHEVFVAGDIALHLAPWTMTGTAPDGSPIAQSGLSVAVLRRQPDGRWRMVIDNPHGQHLTTRA